MKKELIRKALLEAKFMAKPEDMDKLMPKLDDDDLVKLVDESDIAEGPAVNDPKIEKYVIELNKLIASAIDSDGYAIPVVDKSGSWEEPVIYLPILYKNGALDIKYKSQYDNDIKQDIVLKRNMEFDGIPQLKLIRRLYVNALKNQKPSNLGEDENERAGRGIEYGVKDGEVNDKDWEELHKHMNEDDVISSTINTSKLRADVAKFIDKLQLQQFDSILQRIDKPQEQAEIIAAFAERIGVPRVKLPQVIASLKNVAETTKITKSRLEEFIINKK